MTSHHFKRYQIHLHYLGMLVLCKNNALPVFSPHLGWKAFKVPSYAEPKKKPKQNKKIKKNPHKNKTQKIKSPHFLFLLWNANGIEHGFSDSVMIAL